jgi:hypothetical protein
MRYCLSLMTVDRGVVEGILPDNNKKTTVLSDRYGSAQRQ